MNKDSDKLRRICRELGFSQLEMALAVGVSPRMFENYLTGNFAIPKKVMQSANWVYFEKTGDCFDQNSN